tara:strand:+ start:184 stop:522 length:339 start_codon:yes stop_codon:yes gene_type:complete
MNPKTLVIISTILLAVGQIFWKSASETFSFNPITMITNIPLLIGIALYGIGAIILIKAIKTLELSSTHPLLALNFLWIALLAAIFLNESLTITKLISITIIIIGVTILAKKC